MYYNSFADYIFYAESVCHYRHISPSVAFYQWRKIAGVSGMRLSCWIIMATRVWKSISHTAYAFVDMKSEKNGFRIG